MKFRCPESITLFFSCCFSGLDQSQFKKAAAGLYQYFNNNITSMMPVYIHVCLEATDELLSVKRLPR